jgi:hypothetical protein
MPGTSGSDLQLAGFIDLSKPRNILADAKRFHKLAHPRGDFRLAEKIFVIAKRLFDGRYPGYQACATQYHDYAHSVSVFAAVSRLADGCALAGLDLGPDRSAELLVAALLHDAGYIRADGDTAGTGAQYTMVHVDRSAAFVLREAETLGLSAERAGRIARMILGTDLARPWDSLSFADPAERLGAEILAAADILGQMADRAYLEKLLFLYYEFREAGIGGYDSAFDILKKTAGFYAATKLRLDGPLGRVSNKGREHFAARVGLDRDLYREAIERQMAYLDGILADDSANFRTKLKRMDLAAIEGKPA